MTTTDAPTPDASAPLPEALPDVPRPVTGRVKRRALYEKPCRIWLVLSVLGLLVMGYLVINSVLAWRAETRLVNEGSTTVATVISINASEDPSYRIERIDASAVIFEYEVDGYVIESAPRRLSLNEGDAEFVRMNDEVEIRYDPAKPQEFTDLKEANPLADALVLPALLLPLLMVFVALLMANWRMVQRAWSVGEARAAVVTGYSSTGLSPDQRQVKFKLEDDPKGRVHTLLAPAGATPGVGERMTVVQKGGIILVADLYLPDNAG